MVKNIELEFRAEVPFKKYDHVLALLKKHGKVISNTKRMSAMFFGKTDSASMDIRVRITNGKAELVIKKGDLHSPKRIEISQPIAKNQFMGMVKAVQLLGYRAEVAERQTVNLKLRNGIIASLVKAGKIVYLELEKLSSGKDLQQNEQQIISMIKELGLEKSIINDKAQFDELCDRLSQTVDWPLTDSSKDVKKLERLLAKY